MTNKILQYANDGAKYGAVAGTTAVITVVGAIAGVWPFLMATRLHPNLI